MKTILEESWWLDWSSGPDRLLWARLREFADGSAEVLDLDGKYHQFPNSIDARFWLAEDEYSEFQDLIEEGEVPAGTRPPQAANDGELVPLMLQELSG